MRLQLKLKAQLLHLVRIKIGLRSRSRPLRGRTKVRYKKVAVGECNGITFAQQPKEALTHSLTQLAPQTIIERTQSTHLRLVQVSFVVRPNGLNESTECWH